MAKATEILRTDLDEGFSPIQSRCDRQTPPRRSKQLPIKVSKLRLLLLFSNIPQGLKSLVSLISQGAKPRSFYAYRMLL